MRLTPDNKTIPIRRDFIITSRNDKTSNFRLNTEIGWLRPKNTEQILTRTTNKIGDKRLMVERSLPANQVLPHSRERKQIEPY